MTDQLETAPPSGLLEQPKSPWRWVFYAFGAVFILYGATQLVGALSSKQLTGWGAWVVGGALLHDLVIAPTVAVIGFAIGRVVPARIRVYVSIALIVSGMVAAVAWPFVLRLGYVESIPSALPLNYAAGLAIVLGAVWVGVALTAVGRELLRARTAQDPDSV